MYFNFHIMKSIGITTLILVVILYAILLPASRIRHQADLGLTPVCRALLQSQSDIKIAKATVMYDASADLYKQAVKLHKQQNKRYGYEMHVLRTPIDRGFANVFLWLQYLIINEMQKAIEEARVDPVSFIFSTASSLTKLISNKT
jgi:hypothetical protein